MGMGFAPTWLRQASPPASQNHFNHCLIAACHIVRKEFNHTQIYV